jgi:hypothetical protein
MNQINEKKHVSLVQFILLVYTQNTYHIFYRQIFKFNYFIIFIIIK